MLFGEDVMAKQRDQRPPAPFAGTCPFKLPPCPLVHLPATSTMFKAGNFGFRRRRRFLPIVPAFQAVLLLRCEVLQLRDSTSGLRYPPTATTAPILLTPLFSKSLPLRLFQLVGG
jgi:hypothetical protein